jgi:predicted permease
MLRLRALLARRALERDMQEEMRAHLDRATERLAARGLSPADARLAARREFGNVTVIQEHARDARGARWIETLIADLRFAVRYFARNKLTTSAIVAMLALGIGANTVIFSVLRAYVQRPIPAVPEDDSQVRVHGLEQSAQGARWRLREFSYPELLELASRRETFTGVAGWMEDDVVLNATDTSEARGVNAEFVTPNYFSLLGVPLAAGPGFALGDAGTPDFAAVISFDAARALFGTPGEAVGRQMLVNDVPVRVAGVAPPRFGGIRESRPRLWLPLSARADIARTSPRWLERPTLSLFARLAPSVTHDQATVIAGEVAKRMLPDSAARVGAGRSSQVLAIRSRPPELTGGVGRILEFTMIGVIALLILLVACTNVSSLMVASAVTRRHEIAVRLSIGASRARLLRQLLTESSMLAIAGGTLGLLIYWSIIRILASRGDLTMEIAPDPGTVAFTMVFALGTGILFGLSPALHATRSDVATALRDSGTGGTHRSRLQSGFVVAQIVCSQPLLLLLGSVLVTTVVDEKPIAASVSDHVISAGFRPLTSTGGPGQRQQVVDSLALFLARQPGVVSVVPEATTFDIRNVIVPGASTTEGASQAAIEPRRVSLDGTAPGYFAILDVPIILGRDLTLADTLGADYAVVIDSDLARALWNGANPIGKTLLSVDWRDGAADSIGMQVVGVYDVSVATTSGAGTHVHTANGKRWRRDALLIRTPGPAQAYLPTLRTIIRTEAPGLPLSRIETLSDINDQDRRETLVAAGAIGGAGALALFLAALGLYSVVALAVTQRRREIGIRLAVGARPLEVAVMFLASGVRLSGLGLALGLPVSLLAFQLLLRNESIPPSVDMWVIGVGNALVVLLVASAAAWLPARRAALVDPATTLRVE